MTHFCRAGSSLHTAFSSCEWELLSGCGAGASCRDGFSPCGALAVGHAGFNVALCRLSCPVARGIFQDQGPKPCPLHTPRWIPNHWTTREALKWSDFTPQRTFGNVWTQLYRYALDCGSRYLTGRGVGMLPLQQRMTQPTCRQYPVEKPWTR